MDGSWGEHSTLDQLICTCHTTMTLVAAGLPPTTPQLLLARQWLSSALTTRHNNSYWILGPLGCLPNRNEALIDQQLAKLQDYIENGAKPNPQQLVEAYYLRICDILGRPTDTDFATSCIDTIRKRFDREQGWFSRSDSTSDGYSLLYELDGSFAASIRDDIVTLLRRRAVAEGDTIHWGPPISTAYTIMNIISSDLAEVEEVRALMARAVRWLKAQQKDDKTWDSAPPYGGEGDVRGIEYPTAVVTRALIAYAWLNHEEYRASLNAEWLLDASNAVNNQGKAIWWLSIALVVATLTRLDEWLVHLIQALFKNIDVPKSLEVGVEILAIFVVVTEVLLILYPTFWRSRIHWLVRKLLVPWKFLTRRR